MYSLLHVVCSVADPINSGVYDKGGVCGGGFLPRGKATIFFFLAFSNTIILVCIIDTDVPEFFF